LCNNKSSYAKKSGAFRLFHDHGGRAGKRRLGFKFEVVGGGGGIAKPKDISFD
jgi:hypothetical protein